MKSYTFEQVEEIASEVGVSIDVVVRIGKALDKLYVDRKSDDSVREAAKEKLDALYTGDQRPFDYRPDLEILTVYLGLKNTQADRAWLRHKLEVLSTVHVNKDGTAEQSCRFPKPRFPSLVAHRTVQESPPVQDVAVIRD